MEPCGYSLRGYLLLIEETKKAIKILQETEGYYFPYSLQLEMEAIIRVWQARIDEMDCR